MKYNYFVYKKFVYKILYPSGDYEIKSVSMLNCLLWRPLDSREIRRYRSTTLVQWKIKKYVLVFKVSDAYHEIIIFVKFTQITVIAIVMFNRLRE